MEYSSIPVGVRSARQQNAGNVFGAMFNAAFGQQAQQNQQQQQQQQPKAEVVEELVDDELEGESEEGRTFKFRVFTNANPNKNTCSFGAHLTKGEFTVAPIMRKASDGTNLMPPNGSEGYLVLRCVKTAKLVKMSDGSIVFKIPNGKADYRPNYVALMESAEGAAEAVKAVNAKIAEEEAEAAKAFGFTEEVVEEAVAEDPRKPGKKGR